MILIEWQSLVVVRRCKHITPILNPCAEIDQDGKPVQPRRCTAYADMFNDFCPHHAYIVKRSGLRFSDGDWHFNDRVISIGQKV